jgi:hypothetical protein
MTEARAKVPDARPGDPLATLSDHLARLLQHADKLLAEWEAHAAGVRARLEADTRSSSEVLQKALQQALTSLSGMVGGEIEKAVAGKASTLRDDLDTAAAAAAEVQRALAATPAVPSVDLREALDELKREIRSLTGAPVAGRRWRPEQLILILLLLANGLGAAVLWVVLSRPDAPATVAPAAPLAPVPAAVAIPDAGSPPAAKPQPAPAAAAQPGPCAHIAMEQGGSPARAVQVCANQLCSPFPPLKVDGAIKPGGPLAKLIASCKTTDLDLLAALQSIERDKSLYRMTCALPEKHEDGTMSVTVRWLLGCSLAR